MAFSKGNGKRKGRTGAGGFKRTRIVLAQGEQRSLFVLQPLRETRVCFLVTADGARHARGTVFLPRWRQWDPDDPAKREVRHSAYADVFSALRGTLHAILGYEPRAGAPVEGETANMLAAREEARDALLFMRAVRSLDDDARTYLTKQLLGLITRLEGSRVKLKREALAQFEKALSLRDALGRENIGALCARLVAAAARLDTRLDDVRSIVPRLLLQLAVLEQELTLMFRTLEAIEVGVRSMLQQKDVFEEPERLRRTAKHYAHQAERLADRTKVLKAKPFTALADTLGEALWAAATALRGGDGATARDHLERARQDLVIPMIERTELGAIHRDLSLVAGGELPEDMLGEVDRRFATFSRRLPELKGTPHFPYEAARDAVIVGMQAIGGRDLPGAKTAVATLAGCFDAIFAQAPVLAEPGPVAAE